MLIPSIDLMNGRAVQLVEGREKVLDAGDPRPIAEAWAPAGEIAVIDLDAALGRGDNASVIHDLLSIARCRVGGGIRTVDAARDWLDAGAERVIIGTAAEPELLEQLPRERVIAALDARDGEVVVEGWTRRTGAPVLERIETLRACVGGFLVTFVEGEGRLGGLPLERVEAIVEAAGPARVTVAGGTRTTAEIGDADRLGADVQVGMALYTEAMDLADALCAPLRSDRPDGLWPTVVTDEHGVALGLTYSNVDTVRAALADRAGVYWSRSRGAVWRKGATSGATQELLRIDADCDRDALRFMVPQSEPGFCHENTRTCFGADRGLLRLARRLRELTVMPSDQADATSYTARLLRDPELLGAKLSEEARELAEAGTKDEVAWEAADVIFFTMVALARSGVDLSEVDRQLDRRERRVRRRPGDAKPSNTPPSNIPRTESSP